MTKEKKPLVDYRGLLIEEAKGIGNL